MPRPYADLALDRRVAYMWAAPAAQGNVFTRKLVAEGPLPGEYWTITRIYITEGTGGGASGAPAPVITGIFHGNPIGLPNGTYFYRLVGEAADGSTSGGSNEVSIVTAGGETNRINYTCSASLTGLRVYRGNAGAGSESGYWEAGPGTGFTPGSTSGTLEDQNYNLTPGSVPSGGGGTGGSVTVQQLIVCTGDATGDALSTNSALRSNGRTLLTAGNAAGVTMPILFIPASPIRINAGEYITFAQLAFASQATTVTTEIALDGTIGLLRPQRPRRPIIPAPGVWR